MHKSINNGYSSTKLLMVNIIATAIWIISGLLNANSFDSDKDLFLSNSLNMANLSNEVCIKWNRTHFCRLKKKAYQQQK